MSSLLVLHQGLLLVGFSEEDTEKVRKWFAAMEAGFPVSSCTEQMLGSSLEGAVTDRDGSFRCVSEWQQTKELVPRAAIFSGLSREETNGIAQYWESSGILQSDFTSFTVPLVSVPLVYRSCTEQ